MTVRTARCVVLVFAALVGALPSIAPAGEPAVIDISFGRAIQGADGLFAVSILGEPPQEAFKQIEIEIGLDSRSTPIGLASDGRPDCILDPSAPQLIGAFELRPAGCDGAGCRTVFARVAASEDFAIQGGTTLFVCHVRPGPDVAIGNYPLRGMRGIGVGISERRVALPISDGAVNVSAATRTCCDPRRTGIGCSDYPCELCVCGLDGRCCSSGWNAECATEAETVCRDACIEGCRRPCPGDCRSTGHVIVSDVLRIVNVALGWMSVLDCPAADVDADGFVSVAEVIASVNSAVESCGAPNE